MGDDEVAAAAAAADNDDDKVEEDVGCESERGFIAEHRSLLKLGWKSNR